MSYAPSYAFAALNVAPPETPAGLEAGSVTVSRRALRPDASSAVRADAAGVGEVSGGEGAGLATAGGGETTAAGVASTLAVGSSMTRKSVLLTPLLLSSSNPSA